MEQDSIAQRIKFLSDSLADSVRAFASVLGEKPTNASNYVTGRNKPSVDFLERLLSHFPNINAHWLLTGQGDAFSSNAPVVIQPQQNNQKNNKGNIVGNITGDNHTFNTLADCAKENANLRTENELLRSQLEVQTKYIKLLETHQAKP